MTSQITILMISLREMENRIGKPLKRLVPICNVPFTSLKRGVNEKLLSAFRVSARMRDGGGAGLRRIDFPRCVAANAARINQRKTLAHLLHLFLILKVRAAAL